MTFLNNFSHANFTNDKFGWLAFPAGKGYCIVVGVGRIATEPDSHTGDVFEMCKALRKYTQSFIVASSLPNECSTLSILFN